MTSRSLATMLGFAVALRVTEAHAQAPAAGPAEGVYSHDGFYFHVAMGYGNGWLSSRTDAGPKNDLSTSTLSSSYALGFSPVRGLVLYGEIFNYIFSRRPSTGGRAEGVSMGAIGPGLAYYLAPWNVYASATIALEGGEPVSPGDGVRHTGPFARFALGKEWWAGPQWGVGLAADAALGKVDQPWQDRRWRATTFVFGLGFSATYQ